MTSMAVIRFEKHMQTLKHVVKKASEEHAPVVDKLYMVEHQFWLANHLAYHFVCATFQVLFLAC